jgi:ethanolaminephosphotransferase
MWLAPNMVTFLGFLHCGISYCATWYYSPNFDRTVPDWVIFLSGYAVIAYYTLDCMDGKQARRTGQSSPLGQLFDHGFDCISNLCHISTQAGFLSVGGTWWFFALQGSIFFAFFMAQWEEYYTGELPHAMGNFGVTGACLRARLSACLRLSFSNHWTERKTMML